MDNSSDHDSPESFDSSQYSYLYIGNIPNEYHSADLRAYFSQYIEMEAFKCFHFKHRPESLVSENKDSPSNEEPEGCSNLCCILQIFDGYVNEFMDKACASPWYDRNGLIEKPRFPKFVKLDIERNAKPGKHQEKNYVTRKEQKLYTSKFFDTLCDEEIQKLPEFKPPPVMPRGNVGTSSKTIMELIRTCKLPSKVLRKLEFQFPKSISKRLYGSVPYTYSKGGSFNEFETGKNRKEDNVTAKKSVLSTNSEKFRKKLLMRKKERDKVFRKNTVRSIPNASSAEDWERHESLHEPREKEILYEEEIELKWEKGGSGLVFYTDEFYWHTMKGSDFDEDTTNDWDIDTIDIYDENNLSSDDDHPKRHGFAKRHLENLGWKMGTGLGYNRDGIVDPIEADGRSSKDKRGLGYFGPKLDRGVKKQKKCSGENVTISTVYDKIEVDEAT